MDSGVYRLTYLPDVKCDLVKHLYFADREKAEAKFRHLLETTHFFYLGYICLHSMKADSDGVLYLDQVIDSKNF